MPQVIFACDIPVRRGGGAYRHADPCTEIVIAESPGRRYLGEDVLPFAPGDVFVYQAGPGRRVETTGDGLHLCLGLIDPLATRLPESVAAGDEGIRIAGAALRHAIATIDEHHERRLGHAAGLLLTATAHLLPPADETAADLARRARAIIDQQFAHLDGVGAIARALNVSGEHLRSRFQAVYGEAPSRALIRRRCEAARQMLVWGELPIGIIAERCGFTNPYHFSRQFRAVTGTTPTQVRTGRRR